MVRHSSRKVGVVGLILASFFTTLGFPGTTGAKDTFMAGTWSVTYLIIDPQEYLIPSTIRSPGFTQTVRKIHRGFYVTVSVDLQPLDIKCPFTFEPAKLPEAFRDPVLEARLTRCRNCVDAARAALGWVAEKIVYSNDTSQPQGWLETLERGTGSCEGRTNVATQLLASLGITSRTVSGCYIQGGEAPFHQWLEITYPESGGFPSEPGISQDYVDPHHIVLSLAEYAPDNVKTLKDLGVTVRKTMEEKSFWAVDARLKTGDTLDIRRRRMRAVRYHAAIAGKVAPMKGSARVMLTMNKLTLETPVDKFGNYSFTGLTSGQYKLTLVADWQPTPLIKFGQLSKRQFKQVDFKAGF